MYNPFSGQPYLFSRADERWIDTVVRWNWTLLHEVSVLKFKYKMFGVRGTDMDRKGTYIEKVFYGPQRDC